MPPPYVLAIDQGTTSTRAVVYDAAGRAVGTASRELTQYYPQPGWVQHDPEEIWASVAETAPKASRITYEFPASGSRSVNEYSVLQQRRLAAGDRTRAGASIGYGAGPGLLSLILDGFGNRPGHPRSQRGPEPVAVLGHGG